MQKIDRWLVEWADLEIAGTAESGFSGINVVEKLLRDPGVVSGQSKDKILWWPKNRRMSKMSKAMHQLDAIEKLILVVHYGFLPHEGRKYTKFDLAKESSIDVDRFAQIRRKARKKLIKALDFIDRDPLT
jgi:hypothetical protein